MSKLCIVTCSNFRRESAAILEPAQCDDVRAASFAAGCYRPVASEDPARAVVDAHLARGDDIVAVGGFCLAGLAVRRTLRLRVQAAHTCLELVAGAPLVDALLDQGAYVMTPGWLTNWRHAVSEWGFTQETARMFFGETTRKLVLLDTGVYEDSAEQLQAFGAFLGLPVETVSVGLERLRLLLASLVLEWRSERSSIQTAASIEVNHQFTLPATTPLG